tara:strand:+ start:514 stop:1185 length:672 start_codon:yes stop_codon:yes gene_type:complete
MAKHYFRNVPDFDYVSRIIDQKNISDYITVKNLFKRVKIRDEIFQDLSYFTKYKVIGDERPDQVALKIYDDSRYDWLVLLANNIVNVESEWPLSHVSFFNYMLRKYGDESKFSDTHHHVTKEVKDTLGRVIVRAGLEVPSDYTVSYFDNQLGVQRTITDQVTLITNYDYEESREEEKRNIFLIKPKFLGVIKNDIDIIMPYIEGSTQFVSDNLVKGDNIRLYT